MTLYSKIIGTGSYLPEQRVSNQQLTDQLAAKGIETSDEWIVTRSGISARHYAAADQKSSDLAVHAAKKALEMADLQPNDIDLIIVASSTPDFFGSFPSTACIVQQKLGMTNNCAAVDVQAVCSGFVYAVSTANSFIKAGEHKNVLVIGAEVFSRILNFDDRGTCVLFGDGAGAVVMTASNEPGVRATAMPTSSAFRVAFPAARWRAAPSCIWMARPCSSWLSRYWKKSPTKRWKKPA